MENEKLVEIITKAVPYPQHLSDWDLSQSDCIRFTWRHDRFRVCRDGLMVEFCEDGMLAGNNLAILLETLLKKQAAVMAWEQRDGE